MQMRLSYDWMTRFYLSFILFYETPLERKMLQKWISKEYGVEL